MNGLNRITLMGNITRDLELRYTMNKKAFSQFSVACNYQRKVGENYEDAVDFIPCVVWGRLAETISKYLQKGSPIYLEGKFKTRTYEKNGEKRYVSDVYVDSIRFIGGVKKGIDHSTVTLDETTVFSDEWNEELPPDQELPY